MAVLRYPTTFESIDGLTVATFGLKLMEWQPTRALRVGNAQFVGKSGGIDLLGYGLTPKAIADEQIRFAFTGTVPATVDALFDAFAANAYLAGLGKLYVTNSDASRRWCWAKLAEMPAKVRSYSTPNFLTVDAHFYRYTDWQATSLTTGSQTVVTSPLTFTITNSGTLYAASLLITYRALAAAGYTDPSIINTTLGQSLSTTRDSVSTSSRLQINPDAGTVKVSTDAGVTYAGDYSLVTVGATQSELFELAPGANSITVTCAGTPNFAVDWQYYQTFEV